MKRTLATIIIAAVAVVIVGTVVTQFTLRPSAAGALASPASAQVALAQGIPVTPGPGAQTGIVVTGEGRVTVSPDLAQITLGVEVSNPSAVAAQQTAASQMDSVVSQLKSKGVDAKDIQTSRYDLSPEYDYSTKTPVLRGYRATNLVTVKVRDVSKLGELLDTVAAAGATRIQGISFSVSDPTAATTQGRDEAMKNARTKADQLAKAAGVSVGSPVLIQETSSTPPAPVDMTPRAAMPAAAAPSTPISPGSQEVHVTVQVVFSIK